MLGKETDPRDGWDEGESLSTNRLSLMLNDMQGRLKHLPAELHSNPHSIGRSPSSGSLDISDYDNNSVIFGELKNDSPHVQSASSPEPNTELKSIRRAPALRAADDDDSVSSVSTTNSAGALRGRMQVGGASGHRPDFGNAAQNLDASYISDAVSVASAESRDRQDSRDWDPSARPHTAPTTQTRTVPYGAAAPTVRGKSPERTSVRKPNDPVAQSTWGTRGQGQGQGQREADVRDGQGQGQARSQHVLEAYTVSGFRTGRSLCTPLTHLSCPDRGEQVVSGHADGMVLLSCALSLAPLFSFYPHMHCAAYIPSVGGGRRSSEYMMGRSEGAGAGGIVADAGAGMGAGIPDSPGASVPSPIISVSLGPDASAPAVIVAVSEDGHLYVKPLPDFVRWERGRTPSALQLAAAPLLAVKGTLLQAQSWTAETAGVLAQNARSLADDALLELRKGMRSSKLAKGVAGWFGISKTG
mmetsp:Transcript_24150/g.53707  ORF Transcript_24150/g.53707 Transcript_24150/m.53707 type:complete len:471 (-) Transcript_24150:206-1618(-)